MPVIDRSLSDRSGVFAGEHLAQLQAAWRRTQRPIKAAWEHAVSEEWGQFSMRES